MNSIEIFILIVNIVILCCGALFCFIGLIEFIKGNTKFALLLWFDALLCGVLVFL